MFCKVLFFELCKLLRSLCFSCVFGFVHIRQRCFLFSFSFVCVFFTGLVIFSKDRGGNAKECAIYKIPFLVKNSFFENVNV